ncbi:sugar transporter ERD6-like 17 [Pistacia vera]|uniref:sugar transporter ERD6-like 17 n=1 Tax=Pistacia vera TaxID=55513 RepID=UPI00126307D2|nr:sugar transporter ERD6-like 17 [Pistacia vera]
MGRTVTKSSVPETKSNTKSIADGDSSAGYSSPAESGIMEDLQLSVAATMWLSEYSAFLDGLQSILKGFLSFPSLPSHKLWVLCLLDIGRLSTDGGWNNCLCGKSCYNLIVAQFSCKVCEPLYHFINTGIHFVKYAAHDDLWLFINVFLGTIVSWRTLAFIGSVPCLLQVFGLFFIPESPRWLDYTKTFERDSEAGILNMFQRRYAYSLLIGVGLMALQQLGGSTAIGYYASSIFEEAGKKK